jgi:uncharacterized protein YoxC
MNIETWLPPAVIITIIALINTLTTTMINKRIDGIDKRIDDLRSQMTREHDNLAKKVDDLAGDVRLNSQTFTTHLEWHVANPGSAADR